MKKIFLISILILGLVIPVIAAVTYSVTTTINSDEAAGTYTTSMAPMAGAGKTGYLNISVYGATWSATVKLQRSFDGSTWYDVYSFTSNSQNALIDKEPGVKYRIGCANGDFTSGSVAVRLSR